MIRSENVIHKAITYNSIYVKCHSIYVSGLGLMGWSPVSFGITLGEKQEDTQALISKIMIRVCQIIHHTVAPYVIYYFLR